MKKILMGIIAAAGALVLSAEMPRSEWHAKVGDCALDPALLKSTISQLSSADKTAFLAEVNAAIDKMPGSGDVKAAKFLAANRAAVAGAGADDRAAVLAEVYATVPPEALTVINEEFAKSEFSRPPTMNEDEFTNIVAQTMQKIAERCNEAEGGAVRTGFAGLMFIRAAGTSSDAVTEIVADALPSDSQSAAKESWFPAALGQGQTATYDPMLAAAQAGEEPNHQVVVTVLPSQTVDSMLMDLQSGPTVGGGKPTSGGFSPVYNNPAVNPGVTGGDSGDTGDTAGFSRVPRDQVMDPESPYYQGKDRGSGGKTGGLIPGEPSTTPTPESIPYWLQNL